MNGNKRMTISGRFLPAAAILLACATAPDPEPLPVPSPAPAPNSARVPEYSRIEQEIIRLVNVERRRSRLDTLVWNPALDRAAKIQAVEMAVKSKMAHELPDATHPTLTDRARFVRYRYAYLAENIAYGYPSAAYAVGGWMASPGHRANILDRAVVETGVGVARAKTGELYFCQVFGARLY